MRDLTYHHLLIRTQHLQGKNKQLLTRGLQRLIIAAYECACAYMSVCEGQRENHRKSRMKWRWCLECPEATNTPLHLLQQCFDDNSPNPNLRQDCGKTLWREDTHGHFHSLISLRVRDSNFPSRSVRISLK